MNDSDRERLQEIRKQAADTPDGREYLVLISDVKLLISEIERLGKVNDCLIAENKRLEAGYCGDRKYASVQDALTETELLRQGLEAERDEMCAALHGRAEYGYRCRGRELTEVLTRISAELDAAKPYISVTIGGTK